MIIQGENIRDYTQVHSVVFVIGDHVRSGSVDGIKGVWNAAISLGIKPLLVVVGSTTHNEEVIY